MHNFKRIKGAKKKQQHGKLSKCKLFCHAFSKSLSPLIYKEKKRLSKFLPIATKTC